MIFLACVLWGFWLLGRRSACSRGVLVVQRAFSFMNIYLVFLIKNAKKIYFTLVLWVFQKYCTILILPYETRFYDVFFTKTKVVPLCFFSKWKILKSIFRAWILRKNVRVLPLFSKKIQRTFGYYSVKSVCCSIFKKLMVVT